jgi:radical SAM protein with 4Fe4S-binding SPASM domain
VSPAPFSVILLPTLQCNVACDYCFEEKSPIRLSPDGLQRLTEVILEHMETIGASDAELYWQGGEALLLGPDWFASAYDRMGAAAAAHGRGFHHYLQSNLIGYGPHWNPVIQRMFEGAVGTSMDYPNHHRRLKNGSTSRYTEVWLDAVNTARRAGLKVSVIAVLHAGSLQTGAAEFLRFFADSAGLDDLQVNLPFPGGPGNGGDTLEPAPLSAFLVELLDVWMTRYFEHGLRLAPFIDLIDRYLGRPSQLPCIWQPNCANEFVTIDARGEVALCDCWVTSYPQHRFGNVFGGSSLTELLGGSPARRAFLDRPARLMDIEDCSSCPHLSLCHGGCPVRTFASKGTILAKDPYCEVYKAIFAKCRDIAGAVARRRPTGERTSRISE